MFSPLFIRATPVGRQVVCVEDDKNEVVNSFHRCCEDTWRNDLHDLKQTLVKRLVVRQQAEVDVDSRQRHYRLIPAAFTLILTQAKLQTSAAQFLPFYGRQSHRMA